MSTKAVQALRTCRDTEPCVEDQPVIKRDETERLLVLLQPEDHQTKQWIICGTASRSLCCEAPPPAIEVLNLSRHSGILDYEPAELTMRVRSGTLLAELEAVLKKENQQLPFEAAYGPKTGTIGGAISVGQAGPARPWLGAVRDAVLGVSLISGKGELLRFGGQVMKNVAGFDVSRLCVGALGTFGPLLDVCVRLLPRPERTAYRCFEMTQGKAIEWLIRHQIQPWPFTGLAWENNCLQARYAGRRAGVQIALDTLGGDEGNAGWWQATYQSYWAPMTKTPLYCLADVPPGTPPHPDTLLLDWGGSRRWFAANQAPDVYQWAQAQQGECLLWPSPALAQAGARGEIQAGIKAVFDPQKRINPHLT